MNTDKDRFLEMFAVTSLNYEKPVDHAIQNLYWNVLKKYRIEEIERAVQQHLEDQEQGMFFPKIAHLMKYLKANEKSEALLAWEVAQNAVKRNGSYDPPSFNDPAITHAIHCLGGWRAFCQIKDSELSFKQKDFIEHYEAFKDKKLLDQQFLEYKSMPNALNKPVPILESTESNESSNENEDDLTGTDG